MHNWTNDSLHQLGIIQLKIQVDSSKMISYLTTESSCWLRRAWNILKPWTDGKNLSSLRKILNFHLKSLN